MQFKHPELLYALFLLLIPIIVHLFQLRKFKKVAFTNVTFLKRVSIQTRKSSQIKKWLILATRLLLLTAIILAFAQPFYANFNAINTKKETVIYLDNSFSMQAKGNNGELLKRAIQDLISNVPEDETISLLTNDQVYKNTTIKAIKKDLLELNYSATTLDLEAIFNKSKTYFSKQKKVLKNLVLISDFQSNEAYFDFKTDSLTQLNLVKLEPINTNNIAIDSAYVYETTATNIILKVALKNSGSPVENVPISLFNKEELIAKTSVAITDKAEATFSLPINEVINGKITINDTHLQFDNTLFFNRNEASKINVLSINNNDDSFLKRLFTDDEFNYTATQKDQLNYNIIDQQHLIILNELSDIPSALTAALKSFTSQGGTITVIPSKEINNVSYNALLNNFGASFDEFISTEKQITTINYDHPLYNYGVFEKKITNFQYPKVSTFYSVTSNGASNVLQFEDGKPFLFQNNRVFVFTAPLNSENSNFKNSPLIVPTLYNMGKNSLKIPQLYYNIGTENTFEVETVMQQDGILTLENDAISIIPKQQYFNNKVVINTSETPSIAGIYAVKNKKTTIKNVSYNYHRNESNLTYQNVTPSKNVTVSNSITEIFDVIKSNTKVNALWKWFVIFALLLLIVEMVILKYVK